MPEAALWLQQAVCWQHYGFENVCWFAMQVLAMVTSMGPLASVEVVRPMLEEVLDYWLTALHPHPPAGASGVAAQRLCLVQHDQQQSWPRSAVWVALKTVFGLLKVCSHPTRTQHQLCVYVVDSTCMHACR